MKRSSVIVPSRGSGANLEIFWSQRQHSMAFLGGFWAFAGGSIDPGDEAIPQAGQASESFPRPEFLGCAARELFEEIGLLVTDRGIRHVSEDPTLQNWRERLHGEATFIEMLADLGETLDRSRFSAVGRWQTPDYYTIGHVTEFFALHLTDDENARFGELLPGSLLEAELIQGEWVHPQEALRSWRNAEKYITPPIRYLLEAFAREDSVDSVELVTIDVAEHYDAWLTTDGVYVIPLSTPTIPPATHTNCVVIGEERLVVIDPGSPYPDDQQMLARLLDQMVSDGRVVEGVILTHHHPDHVGGAEAVRSRYGAPILAHAATARQVDFVVDRELADGDTIELGADSLRCLHTPGHASGHLCLFHARSRALIAGDMVASAGTILINPPDGHMGDYLASLDRLLALDAEALIPGHGWMITNPAELLSFYAQHRLAREKKVFEALRRFDAAATPADLVPDAYDDAPQAVWPLAARSAEAHLIHLFETGRATREDGKYRVASA